MNKKRLIKVILLSILWVVCVLLYLKYDNKQFDYGWGCTYCNKTLPYNLEPNYSYYRSFTLMDEDELPVIGKGIRQHSSSFEINNILCYGYNDTSIIAKCTDSLNNIKYLSSYETKYKTKKGNPVISFRDMDEEYYEQVKDNYRWIEIDEEKIYKISRYKTFSFIGALVLLLIIPWQVIKNKNTSIVRKDIDIKMKFLKWLIILISVGISLKPIDEIFTILRYMLAVKAESGLCYEKTFVYLLIVDFWLIDSLLIILTIIAIFLLCKAKKKSGFIIPILLVVLQILITLIL